MVVGIVILGSIVLIAVVLVVVRIVLIAVVLMVVGIVLVLVVLMVVRIVLIAVVLMVVGIVLIAVVLMVVGIVLIAVVLVAVVLVVLVIGGNVDADFADDVLAQDHKGCAHARFEGDPVAVDIDDVPDNPTGGEDLVPDFELIDQLTLVLCLLALRAENQKVEPGGDHHQDQQRRTRSTRLLGCRGGEGGQGRGQCREGDHQRAIRKRKLVLTAVRL
jgi:hypothetical protein